MKKFVIILLTLICSITSFGQTSPNGKIRVEYINGKGLVVAYNDKDAWQQIVTIPTEYCKLLNTNKEKVAYDMVLGKKSHCTNDCVKGVYQKNGEDANDILIVNVYNDGIAFGGPDAHGFKVDFSAATNNWIMKWTEPYEELYPRNREIVANERYGYPALFEYSSPSEDGNIYALISESCMTVDNAATSMWATETKGVFDLRPDGPENGGYQTIIIGHLNDIVESTLITDNSEPGKLSILNSQFSIAPGLASWVYWANNHGSNDFSIIKKYVDMAVELKLPYVLIDAEWDDMDKVASNNGKTIVDAVRYATDNGIKPIIWYNSSVGWVNGAPGPKYRLNKPEDREKEFAWCDSIGVKGVKIDFFSGDTNLNIRYMIELLECAARHHLLVNFHGATIPRGWQRTYPNLVSTEGVYGEEWYNNVPTFTDKAACHNATLPFTRNVIGSMDYTPCAFTDSQHPHITTNAHELALTVLYESGIQHLADRPESFLSQPQQVKDFLSELPTAWDDTKFVSGYPGEYAVIARRKGKTWYIAGINGTDSVKTVAVDTSRLKGKGKNVRLFEDSGDSASPWNIQNVKDIPQSITLQPRGGFLMVVKTKKDK